jgi:amino acid transporter
MTMEPGAPDAQLRRVIGPGTIALNAMNLSIGSGIFALPAAVAAIVGPAALYAYLVCGAAMALVLLCFAELGSTTARSGGGYAYLARTFGPFWAFLAGVLLWFGFGVMSDAAIAAAMADTLATMVPALAAPVPRATVLIGYFFVIVAVNVRGAREGARMAVLLTCLKLVPLALLVVASMPSFTALAVTGGGLPPLEALGKASLLLFFAFTGAEASLSTGGEIRNVRRDVPRGIMLGCAGTILVYLSVHVAAQSVLGAGLAAEGQTPLAAAAAVVLGPWGRGLLLVGGALSMAATVSGDLLATPRALFATAVDGHLPAVLARVHPRFATPWVAIATYGALTCTVALLGGFALLAALASAGLLLVYFFVCLAVLVERRRTTSAGAAGQGFRIPGGPVVPVLGMVLVAALLANAKAEEWAPLGGLVAVSAGYYVLRHRHTGRGA